MYTETVVFQDHSSFEIDTQYGPKVKNLFTDSQGREFAVWSSSKAGRENAAQLLASLGQQVTISFTSKPNGDYQNYEIKSIQGGVVGAPAPAAATQTAPAPAVAAPAPQAAPTPAPAVPLAQQEKQLLIMRQKAFGDSVMAFGVAGIDPVVNNEELREFAQNVALDFYINGYETEAEAQAAIVAEAATAGPIA